MKTVGLFAGIGGIEYGLEQGGMSTLSLCEILPEARCVLQARFPDCSLEPDVTQITELPQADLLAAGFPCQNLSIAGNKVGISGEKSALVHEIFRLLACNKHPPFVLIENVANLISLNKGEAIRLITSEFSRMGYEWAYRLVDPRSFGIPQRRPRFIFLASNVIHPKDILFPRDEDVDAKVSEKPDDPDNAGAQAYGFYWTEGRIGIGWAKDSIPPLKCGSTLGLPSAPAIWDVANSFFGTPSIGDAERLQGFPAGWTSVVVQNGFKDNKRWKLIGNAVNTAVSSWIGERLEKGITETLSLNRLYKTGLTPWPKAAISQRGQVIGVKASFYPNGISYCPIKKFMRQKLTPLSLRATLGFEKRVLSSQLIKYPEVFKDAIATYLRSQYDIRR